jgi:hypothetical protein
LSGSALAGFELAFLALGFLELLEAKISLSQRAKKLEAAENND